MVSSLPRRSTFPSESHWSRAGWEKKTLFCIGVRAASEGGGTPSVPANSSTDYSGQAATPLSACRFPMPPSPPTSAYSAYEAIVAALARPEMAEAVKARRSEREACTGEVDGDD